MSQGEAAVEIVQPLLQQDYFHAIPIECRFMHDGHLGAALYAVTAGHARYVFRLYGAYWNERELQVQFELEWLLYLHGKGVPVSAPEWRTDGGLFSQLELPDGARLGALFTYADGRVLWPLDAARGFAYGKALAELHLASRDFQSDLPCHRYDADTLVDTPISRMVSYFEADSAEARTLADIGEQVKQRLTGLTFEADEWGPIHADIHQGNVHWADNDTPTLFDFAMCGQGWRTYDLTGMLWPMRDATIDQPEMRGMCDAYLAGYESARPLSAPEKFALPAFVKTRDLWETDTYLREGKPALEQARETVQCALRQFRTHPEFLVFTGE